MPKTPPVNKARPTTNVTEIFSLSLLRSTLSLSVWLPPLSFLLGVGGASLAEKEREADRQNKPDRPSLQNQDPNLRQWMRAET